MRTAGFMLLALALILGGCDKPAPPTSTGEEPAKGPLTEVGKILNEVEEKLAPKPVDPVEPVTEVDPDTGALKVTPVAPVAEPVPGEPGFVFSPYNGKKIDVTGIEAGTLVADPVFPDEEKKYFRVPVMPEPEPVLDEERDEDQEEQPADGGTAGGEGESGSAG